MKKLITMMICIALFATFAKSTNFYVDPVSGNNANSGQTWALAVADISTAISKASSGAFLTTVDNILVKQGTFNLSLAVVYTTIDNIYGSCYGNEVSPDQRPMLDLDVNGIVEPWEFRYPTILTSTLTATTTTATVALKLALTNATFNGFTITHTTSSTSFLSKNIWCSIATTIFENNIVKNCDNTSAWTTSSQYGLIMQVVGTVKNCLFENNRLTVTSAMTGSALSPFISMSAGSKVQGCVIRNNKVVVDYSAVTTPFLKPTSGLKGMIVNIESLTTSAFSTLSKSIIYNNEVEFKPGTAFQNLLNGSIISLSATTGAACTDSIINCTVANNKTTKMQTAGIAVQTLTGLSSYVFNNVMWNNRNTDSLSNTVVNNFYANGVVTAGLISNNIFNGGSNSNINAISAFIANNLNNLDNSNTTATYGPQFKTPTTVIGNTTDGSSALAVWTLNQGSYLIGKGAPTQVLSDLAGVNYKTPRSVGAYEYTGPTAVNTYYEDIKHLTVIPNGIKCDEDGKIQVFSFSGKIIKDQHIYCDQFICLPSGCYIVRFVSNNKTSIQKITI
jgi:ABC-type uncharacterized transport system auxiliary subunit